MVKVELCKANQHRYQDEAFVMVRVPDCAQCEDSNDALVAMLGPDWSLPMSSDVDLPLLVTPRQAHVRG